MYIEHSMLMLEQQDDLLRGVHNVQGVLWARLEAGW